MLFVGTKTNEQNKRIEIEFDGLLHHTLIAGQSGSGKSFLVARLIEEILVRTRARILVIDPNGDFRRISMPSSDVWTRFSDTFKSLDKLTQDDGVNSFDTMEAFQTGWKKRRFTYLSPGRPFSTTRDGATDHRLVVHWDTLDDDQRTFLLNASSSTEPKIFLGLKAVAENARWLQNRPDTRIKMDLRGLLDAARQFAESNVGLREYEYAKILTRDDWYAVQAKIDDLLSQYSIWWSSTDKVPRPSGLADFIDGPFEDIPKSLTDWDALVLSLESSPPADTLLAADVALSRVWLRAKGEWRKRAESLQRGAQNEDNRVPTFIVVDEAHNFAPDRSIDPLRARVTARLMQIASEGRKYGLYLILATQRPTKLHRELVAECENSCVLRLQSKIETEFAVTVLGLSDAEAHAVPAFTRGQGVFFGRWVGGTAQMNTKIAPARIVVGGGELRGAWKQIPNARPDLDTEVALQIRFIEGILRDADGAVNMAALAGKLRMEFGEASLHWYGHETFKKYILSLNIRGLQLTSGSPGFAYLLGVHPTPSGDDSSRVDSIAGSQSGIPHEERIEDLLRAKFGVPMVSPQVFREVFSSISNEVQENEFNLTDTSKAIRDRCAAKGLPVGRNLINFLLKGIHFSGHKFDRDLPQSPEILAEALVRSIVFGYKKSGVVLSENLLHQLANLFSTKVPQQNEIPSPPIPVTSAGPSSNLTDIPMQ
jgi:hypothetical protein